jgi:bacterial surface protein 26-residue repeat
MRKIKKIVLIMVLLFTVIVVSKPVLVLAANGQHGTSDWEIIDGVLYIEEGEFPSIGENIPDSNYRFSPWVEHREGITKIVFNGEVTAIGSQSSLFKNLNKVTDIVGLELLDTSGVTDMSHMFEGMEELENLDLSNFNTSNVGNMKNMFTYLFNITSLNVTSFNTSNVTNMDRMFFDVAKVEELDVSGFNTAIVENMDFMFYNTGMLRKLDLSGFDTRSVTTMDQMFLQPFIFNLVELRLGENFDFLLGQDVALNELAPDENWTGFWQNVGSGTIQNPLGDYVLTSNDLVENYNGEIMADTYIWQPVVGNRRFSTFVEVFGDGEATADITSGIVSGDMIELTAAQTGTEVFKGWIVVSGGVTIDNLGSLENPNVTFENVGEDVRIIAVFGAVNGQLVGEWLYTSDDIELNLSDVIDWDANGELNNVIIDQADVRRYNILSGDSYEKYANVFFSQIEIAAGRYIVGFRPESIDNPTVSTWSIVRVIDNIPPSIETHSSTIEVSIGSEMPSSFRDLFGITASDETTDNVIDSITYEITNLNNGSVIERSEINMNVVGHYTIKVTVKDAAGNESVVELTLKIIDDVAPEITVEHEEVTIEVGSVLPATWTELFGVETSDNVDMILNITYDIDITTIDMSVVGVHIINATVSDSSGNTSTKELRLIVEAKDINDNNTNNNNNNQTTPPTGDVNNLFIMLGLLIISISSIVLVIKKKALFKN